MWHFYLETDWENRRTFVITSELTLQSAPYLNLILHWKRTPTLSCLLKLCKIDRLTAWWFEIWRMTAIAFDSKLYFTLSFVFSFIATCLFRPYLLRNYFKNLYFSSFSMSISHSCQTYKGTPSSWPVNYQHLHSLPRRCNFYEFYYCLTTHIPVAPCIWLPCLFSYTFLLHFKDCQTKFLTYSTDSQWSSCIWHLHSITNTYDSTHTSVLPAKCKNLSRSQVYRVQLTFSSIKKKTLVI